VGWGGVGWGVVGWGGVGCLSMRLVVIGVRVCGWMGVGMVVGLWRCRICVCVGGGEGEGEDLSLQVGINVYNLYADWPICSGNIDPYPCPPLHVRTIYLACE
jgi:hypothetical protein